LEINMSKINSYAVAFNANAAALDELRSQFGNVLHAAGTPKARKLYLVGDVSRGMAHVLPGVRGYKVVPSASTNGTVAIEYSADCTPSAHAEAAQWFDVLSKRVLRQAKSVSQALGFAIEGQRADRSDKAKFDAAATVARLARNHTPAQLRAIGKLLLA
jgi:hypothetical protein